MKKPAPKARARRATVETIVPRLTCTRCHDSVIPLIYSSGPHLRADCPNCRRYLCFVPRCVPWLALLDATPTPPVPFFGGEL